MRLKELTNFIVMTDFDEWYESKDPKKHTSIQELIENPIFWIKIIFFTSLRYFAMVMVTSVGTSILSNPKLDDAYKLFHKAPFSY